MLIKQVNNTKIVTDKQFIEIFNANDGFYVRSGIIVDNKDTGIDPFMRSFPNLIDIGIMGRCRNAHLCTIGCYQGKKSQGENMSLENYKSIIDQCNGKVFQVALGGAGSPDEHPQFQDILEYTIANGIVPNYTTSGIGVTKEIAKLTKKYCGAVAVSAYNQPYTYKAIDLFLEAGCKTNIHYVLSNDSIDEAIRLLTTDNFPRGINAVIFLTHKPVGFGSKDLVIKAGPKIAELISLTTKSHPFKVGFDSCATPAIINYAKESILMDSIDTCEGGRWSCYITPDMIITPCSFDQDRKYGVSLREQTIEQAWHSPQFNAFRNYLETSCPDCKDRLACYGGCPLCKEIVICERQETQLE